MYARSLALVALALLLSLAVGGCQDDDDTPVQADTPTPDATADTQPQPEVRAPLSGMVVDDEAALDRPVVALKIDNASGARPQVGLESAEIVFTELVEGGLTRFLALYHAVHPDRAGPVRSAREIDAELVPAFEPVFGYSGAAAPVLEMLRDTDIVLREEGQPGEAWSRDPSRPAPHNLFARPAALLDEHAVAGPARRPWPIDEEGDDVSGQEIEELRLRYSSATHVRWSFDAAGGIWMRSQDDESHLTAEGESLTASNVIVARVEVSEADRTDSAGNPVVDMVAVGEGDALVLMDGVAIEAQWRREAGGHFSWVTPDGAAIELQPGVTWVELVPTSGGVEISGAAVG